MFIAEKPAARLRVAFLTVSQCQGLFKQCSEVCVSLSWCRSIFKFKKTNAEKNKMENEEKIFRETFLVCVCFCALAVPEEDEGLREAW